MPRQIAWDNANVYEGGTPPHTVTVAGAFKGAVLQILTNSGTPNTGVTVGGVAATLVGTNDTFAFASVWFHVYVVALGSVADGVQAIDVGSGGTALIVTAVPVTNLRQTAPIRSAWQEHALSGAAHSIARATEPGDVLLVSTLTEVSISSVTAPTQFVRDAESGFLAVVATGASTTAEWGTSPDANPANPFHSFVLAVQLDEQTLVPNATVAPAPLWAAEWTQPNSTPLASDDPEPGTITDNSGGAFVHNGAGRLIANALAANLATLSFAQSDFEAIVTLTRGTGGNGSSGLLFRFSLGTGDGWSLLLFASTGNVALARFDNPGTQTDVSVWEAGVAAGDSITLRLRANGATLEVFDGAGVLRCSDSSGTHQSLTGALLLVNNTAGATVSSGVGPVAIRDVPAWLPSGATPIAEAHTATSDASDASLVAATADGASVTLALGDPSPPFSSLSGAVLTIRARIAP